MKLIIYGLLVMFPSILTAQWNYVNKIDDFTDEKVSYVEYTDDDYRIQLSYEGEKNAVWMFISIKGMQTFEPDGIIEYRIDTNDTRTKDPSKLKLLEEFTGVMYNWEPKTVGFLVWHGEEDEGCGFIGELMQGEYLSVRYQVSSMGRKTFKISLEGAKEAIIKGLELKVCGH